MVYILEDFIQEIRVYLNIGSLYLQFKHLADILWLCH